MTALTVTEAGIITRARELLARTYNLLASADTSQITRQGRKQILEARDGLINSLQVHEYLRLPETDPDYIHPTLEYPQLAQGHPDNALEQALVLAADDIAVDIETLADVIAEQTSSDEEGKRAA